MLSTLELPKDCLRGQALALKSVQEPSWENSNAWRPLEWKPKSGPNLKAAPLSQTTIHLTREELCMLDPFRMNCSFQVQRAEAEESTEREQKEEEDEDKNEHVNSMHGSKASLPTALLAQGFVDSGIVPKDPTSCYQ